MTKRPMILVAMLCTLALAARITMGPGNEVVAYEWSEGMVQLMVMAIPTGARVTTGPGGHRMGYSTADGPIPAIALVDSNGAVISVFGLDTLTGDLRYLGIGATSVASDSATKAHEATTADSARVSTIAYGPAGDTWTGAVAVYDEYQITGGFLLPYAPLNSRVCTLNYYVHLDTVFARTKVEAPRLIGRHVPVAFDTTSTTTPTPNADLYDQYSLTALAADAAFAAPTGTPVDGQKLVIRIEDDGTARDLTWNAIYEACGDGIAAAIDSTTLSKKMYVGCIYNTANTKWDVVAVSEEE